MPNFQPIERCTGLNTLVRRDVNTIVATIAYSCSASGLESCHYTVNGAMDCTATWERDNSQTLDNSFLLLSSCCQGSKGLLTGDATFRGNGPDPGNGIFFGGTSSGSRVGDVGGGCSDESATGQCSFSLALAFVGGAEPQRVYFSVTPTFTGVEPLVFPGAAGEFFVADFMPGDYFEFDLSGTYDALGVPDPAGPYTVSSIITLEAIA